MNKNFIAAAVSALGALLVTFCFQAVIAYFTVSSGEVTIGPPVQVDQRAFQVLQVTNESNQLISNLVVSVPSSVDASKIGSSSPLAISPYSAGQVTGPDKYLDISGFAPRTITRVLVPLENASEAGETRVINYQEKNLDILTAQDLPDRFRKVAETAGLNAFVYAIIVGVVAYLTESSRAKWRAETDKQLVELRAKLEKDGTDFARKETEVRSDMSRLKLDVARFRAQYVLRNAQLAKELNFWRDTIRKILYSVGQTRAEADKLFLLISDQLHTPLTHVREADMDRLEGIAELLRGGSQ